MTDKIQDFIDKYGKDLRKEIDLYSIIKAFNLFRKGKFVDCHEFIEMIRKGVQGMENIERKFLFPDKHEWQAPFTKEIFTPKNHLLENIEVDFEQVSNAKKPPMRLMPKKLHTEQRFAEVCSAVTNYYNASKKIPVEWIEEYNELIDILKL